MECNVKVMWQKWNFLITMPLLFQVKSFYTKMEFNVEIMWQKWNFKQKGNNKKQNYQLRDIV